MFTVRHKGEQPVEAPPVQSVVTANIVAGEDEENWLVARGDQRFGPYDHAQLASFAQQGRLFPTDLTWRPGMTQWRELHLVMPSLHFPPPAPALHAPLPLANSIAPGDQFRREFIAKKIPAGLCAIFLGSLGIHKFILGLTNPGIIMLCTWVSCLYIGMILILPLGGLAVLGVIALVEGINYLSMSDDRFFQTYAIEKKPWF